MRSIRGVQGQSPWRVQGSALVSGGGGVYHLRVP